MQEPLLTERSRLHIEIALGHDCGCKMALAKLETRADRLGLTGIELDAARGLHSFDVRIAAAIDFACALGSNDSVRVHAAVMRALTVGYNMLELEEIAKLVDARNLHSAEPKAIDLNPDVRLKASTGPRPGSGRAS